MSFPSLKSKECSSKLIVLNKKLFLADLEHLTIVSNNVNNASLPFSAGRKFSIFQTCTFVLCSLRQMKSTQKKTDVIFFLTPLIFTLDHLVSFQQIRVVIKLLHLCWFMLSLVYHLWRTTSSRIWYICYTSIRYGFNNGQLSIRLSNLFLLRTESQSETEKSYCLILVALVHLIRFTLIIRAIHLIFVLMLSLIVLTHYLLDVLVQHGTSPHIA
jgi:hypothetical protein